jgi:hypothetical protein
MPLLGDSQKSLFCEFELRLLEFLPGEVVNHFGWVEDAVAVAVEVVAGLVDQVEGVGGEDLA